MPHGAREGRIPRLTRLTQNRLRRSRTPSTRLLSCSPALEDARDVLTEGDHLAVVAQAEHQIEVLNRRLGFDNPEGGAGGR